MSDKTIKNNVACRFSESVCMHPHRVAIETNDCKYSYTAVSKMVGGLQQIITNLDGLHIQYVSVFSGRTLTSYISILATLCVGKAYIPLHPDLPSERIVNMLEISGVTLMVVDAECKNEFQDLLKVVTVKIVFIVVGFDKNDNLNDKYPEHEFIYVENIESLNKDFNITQVNDNDLAYLLFTSGSTGQPKGVPVSHKNVCSYINYITDTYNISESDRFSHMFELNFDLSIHDMFVCWASAACLCIPSSNDLLFPVSYIEKSGITMWFSVPSVAMFIDNYGRLEPNKFRKLRYSFFCGEALPVTLANKWSEAAPNSIVENLYGPTEATIAISRYTLNESVSEKDSINGIVPMGHLFAKQYGRVIDENGNEQKTGVSGELCLSGTQVTKGYLGNPSKTKSQYIQFNNTGSTIWYKTGDRVYVDKFGCYYYLGRIDNQVKVLGHRVELAEIDHAVREFTSTSIVATIAWPLVDGIATGIVCFVCGSSKNEKSIINYCRTKLPRYMVPDKVHFIESMPLNISGKIDRLMLRSILDSDE